MNNFYRGVEQAPFHLSVGAVLRNEMGEIAAHHFAEKDGMTDVYTLMRETMEPWESPEDTLHSGLLEEFGAKARIAGFLGPIVANVETDTGETFLKTTLYFLCELIEMRPEWRDPDDDEKDSTIEWHPGTFLIRKMQEQFARHHKEDMDESAALERLRYFK